MWTSAACSETALGAAGTLVVLEGMPGSGKTTAANMLAADGYQVIGEYVADDDGSTLARPPEVGEDDAHQRNWLTKQRLVDQARRAGPVCCDRDWLSALGYAATVGQDLLDHRSRWALRELAAGRLSVADHYVVLHLDPITSLDRRRSRLVDGHPWNNPATLATLAAFYADPLAALDPRLAELLQRAQWHHLCSPTRPAIQDRVRGLVSVP